ncbi:hypothetical protein [Cystobacter fuscus]|uniref:hypothetical protein n=1 Tax=Cystobacter fuscus TaxID=43 RepID=UPI0037C0F09D
MGLEGHLRELYAPRFELLLTEVATRNTRSMRANERVGFQTVRGHRDAMDEWALVPWDWSAGALPRRLH